MANELESTLRGAISEVGKLPPDFDAHADLYNDLGLDSFRMVEIFMEVERRFGVTISEDDYLRLRSLSQFIELLRGA